MTMQASWTDLVVTWIAADEAPRFAEGYTAVSGLRMRADQALDGRSRGFYREGRLVGGYRLGHEATRYPALVGEEGVARWPFDPRDAVEITHLWMVADLDVETRRTIYGWMVVDILRSGKRFVLGGAVDPVAARQQRRSLPHLLEERTTTALGPTKKLQVYYGTVTTMLADAVATGIPLPWLGLR